jgi:hypothetical protein
LEKSLREFEVEEGEPDCSNDYEMALQLSMDPDVTNDLRLALELQRQFDRDAELQRQLAEAPVVKGGRKSKLNVNGSI